MSLPTPDQQAALTKLLANTAANASTQVFGFPLDASKIEVFLDVAVAAACMQAWREAHAAGQKASDAVNTEGDAERQQRGP